MKSYGVTIQMKATEQYFSVVLYIMLYNVVLTFESVDEILKWHHYPQIKAAGHTLSVDAISIFCVTPGQKFAEIHCTMSTLM